MRFIKVGATQPGTITIENEGGKGMSKVLVEIKDGTVMNVETTSEDVEVYVIDHDLISEGSIGELKRHLADLAAPVEVDGVVLEDELMAKLEDLIAEGKAKLEDMADAWEDEKDEVDEFSDLTRVMRPRR
jgi:hypothetical protein